MNPRRAAFVVSVALIAWPQSPRAQAPETEDSEGAECVSTYEGALADKKRGALTAAHKRFAECTLPACPGPVREECTEQVRRLKAIIPTVVPRARTRAGDELVDVRVLVDGRLLTEQLDGRAHAIDPGPHQFRFEAPDAPPEEVRAVLAEGERLRQIEVVLGGDADTPRPIPIAVYVLGGVGVLGLAGFTYFGLSGLSQESDLDACTPGCTTDQTDDVKQTYLFADISLAIGIAALGGATYLYVSSRSAGSNAPAPTLDGKVFGIGGVF